MMNMDTQAHSPAASRSFDDVEHVPRRAWLGLLVVLGPVLLVALLSFLSLAAVLLAPIRGATRTPIGTILAAE